jgi:type IV secretion system protein VirD4
MGKPQLLNYKSRRTPGQNAMIAFVIMMISFVAFGALPTQWFAAQYNYDANLGAPLARAGGIAVYLPVEWVRWGWRLADIETLRGNVHVMMMMGTASVILAILFTIWVSLQLNKHTGGMEGLHGTAHWAEKHEVNNTGFLSTKEYANSGVVVGSVMLDRKGKVIHPHHPKFDQRYMPYEIATSDFRNYLFQWMWKKNNYGERIIPEDDWKRFLCKRTWMRDSNGQPMYALRRSVVSSIELLRDGKNTHLFAFCPTRSGKGRGMIIPTLTTWANSVMVNDPKGEAYALTAGFRKAAGQEVIKFEPSCTNGTGARWNPLDEIRIFTPFDVQDAQMIMSMACDPKGEGLDDYFDKAGYEFLFGLALHVKYAEKNGSLQGVAQFLGDPGWDSDEQMFLHMLQTEHDPEGKMNWVDGAGKPTKTHPIVANVAQTMRKKEDKDRSGVMSTAKALLSLYLDPVVAQNTNCSDFLVRDLMTHHKPVSLYYVVGPADMDRMTPLTRLFYALFIRRNAADMEFEGGRSKKSYTFPLLMIIDEMTSLRKLPIIEEALGYVAGYGIRMFMLVQDIAQVESFYTDKQTVDSGAETRIVYAPNKPETAEKIVKMAGKTTVTEQKASTSRDIVGIKAGSVSISTEKVGRDLITTEEIMSLNDMDVIIFVKGQPPIYGRKAWYDENPVMLARAKMAPPARSSAIRTPIVPGANAAAANAKKPIMEETPETALEIQRKAIADNLSASRQVLHDKVYASLANNGGQRDDEDEVTIRPASGPATQANQAGNSTTSTSASSPPAGTAERRAKPRSRYASAVHVLTEEERKQVSNILADVAVTDKVMRISAFN